MKTTKATPKHRRIGKKASRENKKRAALVLCGILFTGFSVYALADWIGSSQAPTVKPEVAIANLKDPELKELNNLSAPEREKALRSYGKAIASNFGPRRPGENGREQMDQIRKTIDSLPENEQKAFRDGMHQEFGKRRQQFQEQMQQKVTDFFKADAATQEKMLEEEVARIKQRREEYEKRRAEREKSGKTDDKKDRPHFRERSKDERENHMRERLNEHSPAERAQFAEYMRRLHEKMKSKK